jgi:hypothetical protein
MREEKFMNLNDRRGQQIIIEIEVVAWHGK